MTRDHREGRISAAGDVTTFAGIGTAGAADGQADRATFDNPRGVAVDAKGVLFVVDQGNHKIRKITP